MMPLICRNSASTPQKHPAANAAFSVWACGVLKVVSLLSLSWQKPACSAYVDGQAMLPGEQKPQECPALCTPLCCSIHIISPLKRGSVTSQCITCALIALAGTLYQAEDQQIAATLDNRRARAVWCMKTGSDGATQKQRRLLCLSIETFGAG